jgi:hypothetical protein
MQTAAPPTPVRSTALTPTPSASPSPMVIIVPLVRRWDASCVGVAEDVCERVGRRYVDVIAPQGPGVFNASGGHITVEPRPDCPEEMNRDVDPTFCWQAEAMGTEGLCIVFARYVGEDPRYPQYVQVGGRLVGTLFQPRRPCI